MTNRWPKSLRTHKLFIDNKLSNGLTVLLKSQTPSLFIIFCFCLCCKDKKAAKEKEREQRIAEAELESVHSARNVEAERLKEILAAKGLKVKEVRLEI